MIANARTGLVAVVLATALALVAVGCEQPEAVVGTIEAETLLSSPPLGALILDVRSRDEFAGGHVPGATNIPHDELGGRLEELASAADRPIIVYCESGRRAGMAGSTLLASGYTNVIHLEGDMGAWRSAGRPTER